MRICLLAEGSYPYIVGGVSAWIQMLIQGMPEHEFIIYAIGAEEKDRGNFKYKLPSNVVAVKEIFLDTVLNMSTKSRKKVNLNKDEKKILLNLLTILVYLVKHCIKRKCSKGKKFNLYVYM